MEKEFLEQSIPSEITLKLDEPLLVELNNETEDQRSMRNIEKNIKTAQQNNIVKTFVKFSSNSVDQYKVETGWQYSNSNAREPELEWCYTQYLIDDASITNLHKIAISFSDAIILGSQKLGKELGSFIEKSDKPMLHYQSEDSYIAAYNALYDELLEEEPVLS